MPPIALTQTATQPPNGHIKLNPPVVNGTHDAGRNRLSGPLRYQGSLDVYPVSPCSEHLSDLPQHFEVTPSIGREYTPELQLSTLLIPSPENDARLRDLAVLISRRGVLFLRDQDIDSDGLMRLAERISDLSGSPKESGHVRHPVGSNAAELPKVGVISADKQRKGGGINRRQG